MSALSLRYARAFSQVAKSSGIDVDLAQGQLHDFAALLADNRQLREVLFNPSIPAEQKLKVLDGIGLRTGMVQPVRNLIAVVLDHQRLSIFDEILKEYAVLADEQAGVAEAEVVTARPLDEAGRAELESHVAQLVGSRVRTSYAVDASLLGGAVVRIGSTVHDGSLRAQLEQLKQTLIASPVA